MMKMIQFKMPVVRYGKRQRRRRHRKRHEGEEQEGGRVRLDAKQFTMNLLCESTGRIVS